MTQISTHLNVKPYQVATSNDRTLIHRKWYHHAGFAWAVSSIDAGYMAARKLGIAGNILKSHSDKFGVVYEFAGNKFVKIGFGS